MLSACLSVVVLVTSVMGEFDPHIQVMYETLPRDQFIEYFNSLNFSFTISRHNLKHFRSGIENDIAVRDKLDVIKHDVMEELPENFDARKKWSYCTTINEIYDQEDCSSCWTFGSGTTASDRTCIHKNITVRLAQQDFDCFSPNVCQPNDPAKAFQYWIDEGLVSQECKPYDVEALRQGKCERNCKNGKDYEADKLKGSSLAIVNSDDTTIKMELFLNGPIQAGFKVYEDFHEYYSGGVYVHTFGKFLGRHSIRVIGYGIEKGVKYWLAANSWSKTWGDEGFFKIQRFQDSIEFEDYLLSCLP